MVTVLGAGIVGLCTALALQKTGFQVRIIDADAPGKGTSFGNAGVISPWSVVPQSMPGIWRHIPGWLLREDGPIFVRPRYFPVLIPWGLRFLNAGKLAKVREISTAMAAMNESNIELYREILKQSGDLHLVKESNYVHAFRDPDKLNLDSLEYSMRRQKGAELETIGESELHALEPALSSEFKAAVLIKNQARALSPLKISEAIARQLKSGGADFVQQKVLEIKPASKGGWKIKTDSQKFHSPKLVVALGAWSAKLLKPLGLNIPMEAERGYHAEFAGTGISLNNSVMDMDLKMVASSMEGGVRIAGTAEFAGLDFPENQNRINGLVAMTFRMLPALSGCEPSVWMGSRPSLPDSLPCIGEISGHPGLMAAFGHSHYGLMMAPKTGQIISDLVIRKDPGIDITPFKTDRFG